MYVPTPLPLSSFPHHPLTLDSGSEQSNGMAQYTLWCALEAEGLGVNLQHYNPLIDTRLETMYGVPVTWSLKSQMVFGKPTGEPAEKKFKPVEERVKFFGE